MGVFWLVTPLRSRSGTIYHFPIDVPECDRVDDFMAMIHQRGSVSGDKLTVQTCDDGARVVIGRARIAVTISGVATLQSYDFKLAEE